MCPSCGAKIAFYDNIPILSYLWLRGRCRRCGAIISLRYLVVEVAAGLFAVAMLTRHGLTLDGFFLYALVSALLVVAFIDIDHQIIPDVITCPGIVVGFFSSFVVGYVTYKESLMGIVLVGGILLLVATGYYFLTKKEGMGGGDIKLLAMIGAFIGWKGVLLTIFLSSAIGTLSGLLVMLRSRKTMKMAIPFGPFLSIGATIYIFFGKELIFWYFRII